MSQSIGVGMGVFVFRSRSNMRFVFGKRKGSLGSGTFALTGGHLEFGETFEQGARREVLEETGLEIVDVKFLTTVENFYEQEGKHYITIFVVAFAKGGGESGEAIEAQDLEPDKSEPWQWWSVEQLRERFESSPEDLFLPMRNLFEQRPEVTAAMERGQLP